MQSGKSAFEIPKYVGTNINFDREPMSAMEYLISVRNEASQIPDVMTVSVDNIPKNQTESALPKEQANKPEKEEWYSEEWKQLVLDDFQKLRDMVADKRTTLLQANKPTLPHENDESGWEYYCFPKKGTFPADAIDPTEWNCRKPDLSDLVYLDYITTNTLLNYHYEWAVFDELPVTKGMCYWFYTLFVLVDLPVNSRNDLIVCIRGIYTFLLKKRSELEGVNPKSEVLSFIDIVLVIAGTYFHQDY